MRNKKDSWFWLPENKGDFSVRSCYRLLRGEYQCQERRFWNRIWSLRLPGKIANFLWRVSRDVLPTAAGLLIKKVDISPICTWCHSYPEDAAHVLFTCCFARELWESTGLANLVLAGNESTAEVIKRVFTTETTDKCALVGLFCWGLWSRRNKWVWEKINMSVFGVRTMGLNMLAEWSRAQEIAEKSVDRTRSRSKSWCKPPEGWVKINVDAAFYPGSERIGVGCVMRDDRGKFIRARMNTARGGTSAREAEAISMREALSWIKSWRTTKCVFESDAKLLVDAFYGPKGKSCFDTIVEDCNELLKHYDDVLIEFVPRSANSMAHTLARAAHSSPGLKEWHDTAPDIIICNLSLDEI